MYDPCIDSVAGLLRAEPETLLTSHIVCKTDWNWQDLEQKIKVGFVN